MMTLLLLLLSLLPEKVPPVVPPPLTSQATEAAAAAAAVLSFSFKDPPRASSKKFARGGSVSEKERTACARDFAAAEDEDEAKEVTERVRDACEARVRGDASEARGEESGRRTPQPEKRS